MMTLEEYFRAARREMARVDAEFGSTMVRPRRRKPTLDHLIAKAMAVGARSVVVDGVEMKFGEPGAAPSTSKEESAADELMKWRERRARRSQGH
jgi:hypothetical protein